MSLFLVLAAVGRGDGTDWEFDIYLMTDKIFHLSLVDMSNARVSCNVYTREYVCDLIIYVFLTNRLRCPRIAKRNLFILPFPKTGH